MELEPPFLKTILLPVMATFANFETIGWTRAKVDSSAESLLMATRPVSADRARTSFESRFRVPRFELKVSLQKSNFPSNRLSHNDPSGWTVN